MVKLQKSGLFKAPAPRAETTMDKTSRAVREILDGETEEREVKTARLRKARLEREANAPAKVEPTTAKGTRKKPKAKAAT